LENEKTGDKEILASKISELSEVFNELKKLFPDKGEPF